MYKTENAKEIIKECGETISALQWMGSVVSEETRLAQNLVTQGHLTKWEANQRLLDRQIDKLIDDQNTLVQRMFEGE
jgi:hypothetical protein